MSYELLIERGKIREFARAVQSRNPEHIGKDAVIPPTYLTMARLAWEHRRGHRRRPAARRRHLVTVDLTCTRQTGGVAISATADFLLM